MADTPNVYVNISFMSGDPAVRWSLTRFILDDEGNPPGQDDVASAPDGSTPVTPVYEGTVDALPLNHDLVELRCVVSGVSGVPAFSRLTIMADFTAPAGLVGLSGPYLQCTFPKHPPITSDEVRTVFTFRLDRTT